LEDCSDSFRCSKCRKYYPILGYNFVELLTDAPFHPPKNEAEYWEKYRIEFAREFTWIKDAVAWGRRDTVSKSWSKKRRRQVDYVKSILKDTPVVCDVSAGSGSYTFELAKKYPLVIHCDISVENLNDVYRRKERAGLNNLLLIRCDYFQLPFHNSLDQLICMDTLIRGYQHETRLLISLYNALSSRGKALIDFHNWWHNPLRRLGLMPRNFGSNKSYTQESSKNLISQVGIKKWEYFPFYQELGPKTSPLLGNIIPATRLMYYFEK
jgi:SAM-dependent methyltransferase